MPSGGSHPKRVGIVCNGRRGLHPVIFKLLRHLSLPHVLIPKTSPDKQLQMIAEQNVVVLIYNNGTDKCDVALQERLGCTIPSYFGEYGWLGWNQCGYLDRLGIANLSSLHRLRPTDIPSPTPQSLHRYEFVQSRMRKKLENTDPLPSVVLDRPYVLVPLQVDGDSKLRIGSPYFDTMTDFIQHIIRLVPPSYMIVFRNHPFNRNPPTIPTNANVCDGSSWTTGRWKLIRNAKLVIGINSTMLIESLSAGTPVVAYGNDVFSNKQLVFEATPSSTFDEMMQHNVDQDGAMRFLCHLADRQIYPERSLNNTSLAGELKACYAEAASRSPAVSMSTVSDSDMM